MYGSSLFKLLSLAVVVFNYSCVRTSLINTLLCKKWGGHEKYKVLFESISALVFITSCCIDV